MESLREGPKESHEDGEVSAGEALQGTAQGTWSAQPGAGLQDLSVLTPTQDILSL